MPELRVITGAAQGSTFSVRSGIASLGRAKTNTICINDFELSRHHAELHVSRDKSLLIDMSSANGTFVNGERIKSVELADGDKVKVGQTELEYCDGITGSSFKALFDTVAESADESMFERLTQDSVEFVDEVLTLQSNLDVLYHSALAAGAFKSSESLLRRILDLVFSWVSADRACIEIREHDRETYVAKSMDADVECGYSSIPFDVHDAIIEYVKRLREGVVINGQNSLDPEFFADFDRELIAGNRNRIICAPIIGRNGVRGVIYAERIVDENAQDQEDSTSCQKFDAQQLKLLSAIGLHAAVAIESAEHYEMVLRSERGAAVGNAMASLSHYIKNLLQSINGGNHLIEMGLESESSKLVHNGWRILKRNQETLSHLMMDMLLYGKSVASKPQEIDLLKLLDDVIEKALRKSNSEDVDIVMTSVPDDLPPIWLDEELVARALENILVFCIHSYEEREGTVNASVQYCAGERQAVVEFVHKGVLTPSELQTLFDPFSFSTDANRLGLGLAVASRILNEAGVKVDVNPSPPGSTAFRIAFDETHLRASNIDSSDRIN